MSDGSFSIFAPGDFQLKTSFYIASYTNIVSMLFYF